jgi:hypothetical protein
MRFRSRFTLPLLALTVLISSARPAIAQSAAATAPATTRRAHNFAHWEKDIAAFEKQDQTNPPPKHCIVFTGSSSIVRWKTIAKDFPGLPVINRGFGGCEQVDVNHFADRIIFPYEPSMIVLRVGSNDIHAGKSADEVFNDFKTFATAVHEKLPDCTIVYIGQSPAPIRWADRFENKALNEKVKAFADASPQLKVKYVEMYDVSITPDGKPREDLFVADRLHFNAEGNRLMADRVRPFLPPSDTPAPHAAAPAR